MAVPSYTEDLTDIATADEASGSQINILGFSFDTNNPVHRTALIAISGALVILLLLLLVVVRLLFRRDPSFSIQLPPYANVPPMSPATDAGRRQGWQFHAQNDLLPPRPANEGSTHIRKILIGIDGEKLSNWEIAGLRLSQYDQYGRVTRSEVIKSRGFWVRNVMTRRRIGKRSSPRFVG